MRLIGARSIKSFLYRNLVAAKVRNNEAVALLSVRANHQVLCVQLSLRAITLRPMPQSSGRSISRKEKEVTNLKGEVDGLSCKEIAIDYGIPMNTKGRILEAQDNVAIDGQRLDISVSTRTAAHQNQFRAEDRERNTYKHYIRCWHSQQAR